MFFACIFYRSGPIPFKIGGHRDCVCPERFPGRLPRHFSLDVPKIDCTGERIGSGRPDPTSDDQFDRPGRVIVAQSGLCGSCDTPRA